MASEDFDRGSGYSNRYSGYRLMVFDATGPLYHGVYLCSLDDFPSSDDYSILRCHRNYYDTLAIHW